MRTLTAALLASALGLGAGSAFAQDVPAGYPADYASTISTAKTEGKVVIYTSTDIAQAQALLDGFTKRYGIPVEYNDLGTNGAYNRAISEAAAGQVGADIVWSSAMDLQATLAADGYVVEYDSPEKVNLPEWANYEDMLFATTVEPIGMIYNTSALPKDKVPTTHAALTELLTNDPALNGRVATFDPEKSGTGFLHHTHDVVADADGFWPLAKALGGVGVRTYSSSGSMRETVVSGENVLAYNIIGSYALDWVKSTPNLGVGFFTDYTSAFSRLAGITKDAPHPEAAKLFVDYMLSKEGQDALASGGLPSVREDVTAGLNIKTLNDTVGGALKPIPVDETLLEFMQPQKRVEFFKEWQAAVAR